jgi:hypothetical protein
MSTATWGQTEGLQQLGDGGNTSSAFSREPHSAHAARNRRSRCTPGASGSSRLTPTDWLATGMGRTEGRAPYRRGLSPACWRGRWFVSCESCCCLRSAGINSRSDSQWSNHEPRSPRRNPCVVGSNHKPPVLDAVVRGRTCRRRIPSCLFAGVCRPVGGTVIRPLLARVFLAPRLATVTERTRHRSDKADLLEGMAFLELAVAAGLERAATSLGSRQQGRVRQPQVHLEDCDPAGFLLASCLLLNAFW